MAAGKTEAEREVSGQNEVHKHNKGNEQSGLETLPPKVQ